MKKILVIGCPGSGKSCFSRALRDRLGILVYPLDMIYWNADKTTVSREIFDERLGEILKKDSWIIDGNYSRTMELRLQNCDTVFFFDLPGEVCLDGVRRRFGKPREDMPWIETAEDEEFMTFIKEFSEKRKPQILELLAKHPSVKQVVFHSHAEADAYLAALA